MTVRREVALRRLFRVVNGGTPASDENNWGGGIQWATPVDLGRVHGSCLDGTDRTLSDAGLRSGSAAVPAGSLIVSTRAPIGYVAETTTLTAFNQGCKGLIPTAPLDTRFYRYVTVSMSSQLQAAGQGSTFVELSADGLAQQRVPVLPLAEQRAVADFLDTETARIDALIAKKRRLASLMIQRLRAEADSALESVAGLVPVRRVISRLTSGPRGWASHVADNGAAFLTIANVQRDDVELNLSSVVRVAAPNNAEARRTRVQEGDIVLSITADIGSVGIVREGLGETYVSQHLALLTPSRCLPEWLAFALWSSVAQRQLDSAQYGGTKTQLALEDVANVRVAMPDHGEQLRLVQTLRDVRRRCLGTIERLKRQIKLLSERRQALITAAVMGQLKVPGTTP